MVDHDRTREELNLASADRNASATFEADLNEGAVTRYPLDSYAARLGVQFVDGKSSLRRPARITIWDGLLG